MDDGFIMKQLFLSLMVVCLLASLACAPAQPEAAAISPPTSAAMPVTASTPTASPAVSPTPEVSPAPRTLYGFFTSPPEPALESMLHTYELMGKHADVALFQQNIPWADFLTGSDGESAAFTDIKNNYTLATQNGLDVIFVIDPLNGLNRREFYGLPEDWTHSFGDSQVRAAFTNFTLRIVREFRPAYLGLASEINTYQDAYPDDFLNYLSLYDTVYDMVKAEAPETKIFVTFQWEEMHNLIPELARGGPYEVNWEQMEQFEPRLDVWAISSYPWAAGLPGDGIPDDYYAALLAHTAKPVAVAEGGYNSEMVNGIFPGTPQSQIDYLNAIHTQIGGERLAFWVYLIISDLNTESYAAILIQQGQDVDAVTLGYFARIGFFSIDGEPKPALALWDSFRDSGS